MKDRGESQNIGCEKKKHGAVNPKEVGMTKRKICEGGLLDGGWIRVVGRGIEREEARSESDDAKGGRKTMQAKNFHLFLVARSLKSIISLLDPHSWSLRSPLSPK